MAAFEERNSTMNITDKLDDILYKMSRMQQNSQAYVKDILGDELFNNLKILQITQEKLELIEDEQRRRNLVFYGIIDQDRENYQLLGRKIMDVVNNVMGIRMHWCEIDHFFRIGKYSKDKTRPVMVKLGTQWRKADILYNSYRLKGSEIYVVEEFSKQVEKERRELMPILRELRKSGKYVILKRNKLYEDGKEWKKENPANEKVKSEAEVKEIVESEKRGTAEKELKNGCDKSVVSSSQGGFSVSVHSSKEDVNDSNVEIEGTGKTKADLPKKKVSKKRRLKNQKK